MCPTPTLSGRQSDRDGAAESWWWPVHSRGLFGSFMFHNGFPSIRSSLRFSRNAKVTLLLNSDGLDHILLPETVWQTI